MSMAGGKPKNPGVDEGITDGDAATTMFTNKNKESAKLEDF